MIVEINTDKNTFECIQQQLTMDSEGFGFNYEVVTLESLKEMFGMETEPLTIGGENESV